MLFIYLIKHSDLKWRFMWFRFKFLPFFSNALFGFILSYLFCQIIKYSSFLSLLGTPMIVIYIYK